MLDRVLVPVRGAELSDAAGQPVLLEAEGVVVRGLNATAARVWRLLDGQRSVRDVAHAMATELGVDPMVLEVDVAGFAAELLRLRLVSERE